MCRLGLWFYFLGVFLIIIGIGVLCWWNTEQLPIPNEAELDEKIRQILRSRQAAALAEDNIGVALVLCYIFGFGMCYLAFIFLRYAFSNSPTLQAYLEPSEELKNEDDDGADDD